MKECTKIIDHLNVFNTLICKFITNMDVKYDDEDKVLMLSCSFRKSQDHLVTYMWLGTIEAIEYHIVVGALLFEEVWRKSTLETSTIEAILVRG
jgi:hypothetical protein